MSDESVQIDQVIPEGFQSWNAYWTTLAMPWRTEPEIAAERQQYLAQRCMVRPDIEKGIYPFRDEHGPIELDRADVEWLLAMHESSGIRGPVDRNDFHQWNRKGLDLRGADLCGLDLRDLPLAHTRFGLEMRDWPNSTQKQQSWAAAQLDDVRLTDAYLERAVFRRASLKRADLRGTRLHRAVLHQADLTDAILRWANLADASLIESQLSGCDLRLSFANAGTALHGAILSTPRGNAARLADMSWVGVNLAVVDWTQVRVLGDEQVVRDRKLGMPSATALEQVSRKTARAQKRDARREALQTAVRANRQLATVLRAQGLNDEANRFAYRAQVLQRSVLRLQCKHLAAAGSWLLDFISGYGYEPLRSLATYLIVIMAFAVAYRLLSDQVHPPLGSLDAVVFSVTSFHGRGFSPGEVVTLHNPLTVLAALEAIIGLLIEITFIATFTQRFFAR